MTPKQFNAIFHMLHVLLFAGVAGHANSEGIFIVAMIAVCIHFLAALMNLWHSRKERVNAKN